MEDINVIGVEDAILINDSSLKVDDTHNGCVENKENDAGPICKEITLEVVIEEITNLKHLLHEMMKKQDCHFKETTDEIVQLKTSCGSIEASVETLEKTVKSQVNGSSSNVEKSPSVDPYLLNTQQRFNEDLTQIGSKHNSSIGGFAGKELLNEEFVDVVASKINSSTLVHKPFLPDRWLKANSTCNTKKSGKQTTLIAKSDFKKNSHFKLRESCMVVEGVTKKLFETSSSKGIQAKIAKSSGKGQQSLSKDLAMMSSHQNTKTFETSSPKGIQAKIAKSSGKGQQSLSKDLAELDMMSSHQNTKTLPCIIPKLEAEFNCEPTYDMMLAKRQTQVCAYLFQKTSDPKLMADILVLSAGSEATRADLQCLIPNRVISELVIMLAAARISWYHVEKQQVWCLPPSFVVDFEARMELPKIIEKYCDLWMPAFADLKFIYAPFKQGNGHWFLMIVDVKKEVTYHLDTYCSGALAKYRHQRIQKLGLLLYHLMLDPKYSSAIGHKAIEFHTFKIVEARGIPNVGNSDNAGVWILHWLNMEHYFNPNTLIGTLNENEVRMLTAANLLIGDQNGLRGEVLRKTEAFINKMVDATPIDLDKN